jgi:hypothetical protein
MGSVTLSKKNLLFYIGSEEGLDGIYEEGRLSVANEASCEMPRGDTRFEQGSGSLYKRVHAEHRSQAVSETATYIIRVCAWTIRLDNNNVTDPP